MPFISAGRLERLLADERAEAYSDGYEDGHGEGYHMGRGDGCREAYGEAFDRWLDQYTAAKRAEWEAEQGETEWEGIVLGREVGGSGDWSVTVWRPDEIEEARAMFPGSEYVLGRAKWMPVPDTTNNESEDE